jgi:hypothetical protein
MEDGIRSPKEIDVTMRFMANYVMEAYNGCEETYSTAKVVQRNDTFRGNYVLLGKFTITDASGLVPCAVTFVAFVKSDDINVIVSVLNTDSGNIENYQKFRTALGIISPFRHIACFVASAVSGGEDEQ